MTSIEKIRQAGLQEEIEKSIIYVKKYKNKVNGKLFYGFLSTFFILALLAYKLFIQKIYIFYEVALWLAIINLIWLDFFKYKKEFELRLVIAKMSDCV
jgi:hypothetical protein